MAEFPVNPTRFDPYKNFKFRLKWDGRYVAGVSKVSGLRRTTEVVLHREGGDPNIDRRSPGQTAYAPLLLERGRTQDAMRLWQDALTRNPALTGARVNLAVAQYRAGEASAAQATLRQALLYDPDHEIARKLFVEIRAAAR